MALRSIIKEIMVLIVLSVVLAFLVNILSSKGIALFGRWDTSKGVITANPKNAEEGWPAEIDSVVQAKAIFDKGGALFVDARSRGNYEDGHIPGAISLPVGEFSKQIESFLNQHPSDQPLVIYCSGRTCDDSHNLALLLLEAGFTDVRIFIDGFPGWEAEGYRVE
ncbi:MAG: rhodanese-like domain-containing protein [Desulfobacterales bacterium]